MTRAPAQAVILLSGGLDSATSLAVAVREGFACHTMCFDYGQRHRHEIVSAERVAAALGAVSHRVVRINLRDFGGSALTDDAMSVPKRGYPSPGREDAATLSRKGRGKEEADEEKNPSPGTADGADLSPTGRGTGKGRGSGAEGRGGEGDRLEAGPTGEKRRAEESGGHLGSVADGAEHIPVTYVPARNLVFLSLGVALAETLGARDIFIGVNAVDYSGYPDCRPEFVESFERTANLGTKAGVEAIARHDREPAVRVRAPLVNLSKAEIIRLGVRLGVDFGMTHSCYDPVVDASGGVAACGRCDSCRLRREGFREAEVPDPTRYAGGVSI